MEFLKEFFGIHDNQKKWVERQEYYLRKRLKPKSTPISTNRQTDGLAMDAQQAPRQPVELEMKSGKQPCMRTTTAKALDMTTESATLTQPTMRTSASSKRKKPVFTTGRAPDILKTAEPEHRLRFAMPSVLAMAVGGFRTLLKSNPAVVDQAPPVQNVRSFFPTEDPEDDDSDASDDDECFYSVDEELSEDEPDGKLEETQPLTAGRLFNVKPLHEENTVHREEPQRTESKRSAKYKASSCKRGLMKRQPKDIVVDENRDVDVGWFETCFRTSYTGSLEAAEDLLKEIKESFTHRQNRLFFTSWLVTVQAVIMIVTLSVYGLAPVGFKFKDEQTQVVTTGLSIETRSRQIRQNPWIGPSFEDLIHLGAKYGPCMRHDKKIYEKIAQERANERDNTACCVRLDGTGCVQLTKFECDRGVFTKWIKWNKTNVNGKIRSSGSVCGQDPRDCLQPESTGVHQWLDDITKWPRCRQGGDNRSHLLNMRYEVTGRPCCIGIQGECVMATEDECDFLMGYYHENYTLCSQVNCMQSICGLSDFLDPESPDQFYRIAIALFLHVGIIHCIISITFELLVLPYLETVAGWFRVMIIFMLSGIGGNIVSAFFTPYQPDVGPSGALFGLLAALVIQVAQKWTMWKHPIWELAKLLIFISVLFLIGFLPFVDNFAHFAGFILGLLLSAVFLPYIARRGVDTQEEIEIRKKTKKIFIAVAAPVVLVLFSLFFFLFYLHEDFYCIGCKYFSCIPFTDTFCLDLDTNLRPRQSDLEGL